MKKNLLFICGNINATLIPVYCFEKPDKDIIIENKEPILLTQKTNKKEINFYKFYIKANLTYFSLLEKNENINQINILCFGEVYTRLTGKSSLIYKEPDIKNKINIFDLYTFFPFTNSSIENFFILLDKNFVTYRLNYMYFNIPIIDLNTNEHSLELNNELEKIYNNKKLTSTDDYDFNNKSLVFLDFFKFRNLWEENDLYFPKLSNMNKLELNYNISVEDISVNSLEIQKIDFLINTFSGIFKISDIDIDIQSLDTKKNKKLYYIYNFIKKNNFISFYLMNILLSEYKNDIIYLEIEEVYFSSIIDLKQYFKKNNENFNFNFIIEIFKNPIYKFLLTQRVIYKEIDFLIKEEIEDFGIFIYNWMIYIYNPNQIKNNKNFNYSIPLELDYYDND